MARPMPRAPPVMSAVRLCSVIAVNSSVVRRACHSKRAKDPERTSNGAEIPPSSG
jgi:hypothetical protein